MDTASSNNPRALAKTQTIASGSSEIPANPQIIASELFNVQQRLYQVVSATTVSILPSLILSLISL
jgi:hypothetical protein